MSNKEHKVECSQIGQNVSDIFWTCSLQIVSDKWRGLLIWSFCSYDSHFWQPQLIWQMNGNSLTYTRFVNSAIFLFMHVTYTYDLHMFFL